MTSGTATYARARALQPEVVETFSGLMTTVWEESGLEPELLELVRLRLATLTRCEADAGRRYRTDHWQGIEEDRVARLPDWPRDPSMDGRGRAAIRYAEEFALAPGEVDDACWQLLAEAFTREEAVRLTMCAAVFAEFQRLSTALGLDPGETIEFSPSVRLVPHGTPRSAT